MPLLREESTIDRPNEVPEIDCSERNGIGAVVKLGMHAWNEGDLKECLRCFRKAIRLEPHNGSHHMALGKTFQEMGRTREAIACFERSRQIAPDSATPHLLLSRLYLEDQRRSDQAIPHIIKAIQLDPNSESAYLQLGDCISLGRTLDEALIELRRITRAGIADQALANMGLQSALVERGRYYEARACNEEMLRIFPDAAVAFANLGRIALSMHDLTAAIRNFEEALSREPDNHYFAILYITGLMQKGDYERAREEMNKRRSNFPVQSYRNPLWRGETVKDKTIVLNAGVAGFGDAIQSVRLARVIQDEGAHVIVKTRRELVRLLKTVPGVNSVISNEEISPEADFECGADEIALLRKISTGTYGSLVPYVFPPQEIARKWQDRIAQGNHLNIGINWRGADLASNDRYRQRSIPLDEFRPLSRLEGIRMYSLQKARGAEELSQGDSPFPAEPLGAESLDFLDLAGAISALDLVISVDTSVAHLSAAQGKPTWILLPFAPLDWRWQVGREDDIWYPTARLFRQHEPGEWGDLFNDVIRALQPLPDRLELSCLSQQNRQATSH